MMGRKVSYTKGCTMYFSKLKLLLQSMSGNYCCLLPLLAEHSMHSYPASAGKTTVFRGLLIAVIVLSTQPVSVYSAHIRRDLGSLIKKDLVTFQNPTIFQQFTSRKSFM